MQILAIAGSLRAGSYNRRLLRQAESEAPHDVDWREWHGLAAVPAFNEDDEHAPTPGVLAMRAAIDRADAVLIATPEYNGSIPGQLKNAVDWASRPAGAGALAGKPVAVVGASPSRYGAVRAQAELRRVLGNVGARVLDRELPLQKAQEAFTPEGTLFDPAKTRQLRQILDELVGLCRFSATCVRADAATGAA